MADKKISALTGATTPLAGTEVLPIVQGGSTVKVSVDNLTVGKRVNADSFVAGSTQAGTGFFTARNSSAGSDNVALSVEATNGTSFAKLIYNQTNDTLKLLNLSSYSGTTLELGANSTTGVTFDVNNNIKFNVGNLIQGTAAKGINFTANTAAAGKTSQLLNWYEEGTFTATLTSATPPTTPITATAYYTRIGDTVTVYCSFRNVDNTGAAGAVKVTGLPFTSNANVYAVGQVWCGRVTLTNGLSANLSPSSTEITLADGAGNALSWASTGAGVYAGFQMTYKV